MIPRYLREIIATVLLAIVLALLIRVLWAQLGISLVVVEGYSMHPLFQSGDLVLVKKVPPSDIHVGDIIVYQGCGNRLIIHRVVAICEYAGSMCYVTWGDNNRIPDTGDMTCARCVCEISVKTPSRVAKVVWPGVEYSQVLGKLIEVNGYIYKIPYLGALSLLVKG